MTEPILYPVPAYQRFELAGIGRCFFRLSDGTLTIDGTAQTQTIQAHAEEPYVTPDRWQMVLLLYPGDVVVAGRSTEFMPGTVVVLPPATPAIFRFRGDSLHIACHFTLAGLQEDSLRGHVPQLTPLDPTGEIEDFRATLDFAYEIQHVHRVRASRFCNVLFEGLMRTGTATTERGPSAHMHPTVRKATEWFEIHLADQIRVSDVAAFCGFTRQHLRNLFLRELGITPSRFMRSRRARRAHLLLTQTDRPIKLIADDVGIRDLAHFSRIIKEEYGASPRQIRRGEA